MLGWLRRKAGLRTAVSAVTAPILALQLLLAGMIATQMAVPAPTFAAAICHSIDGSAGTDLPTPGSHLGHQHCAVCAFAAGTPVLPGGGPSIPTRLVPLVAISTTVSDVATLERRHEPRLSQGPPRHA